MFRQRCMSITSTSNNNGSGNCSTSRPRLPSLGTRPTSMVSIMVIAIVHRQTASYLHRHTRTWERRKNTGLNNDVIVQSKTVHFCTATYCAVVCDEADSAFQRQHVNRICAWVDENVMKAIYFTRKTVQHSVSIAIILTAEHCMKDHILKDLQ